MEVIKRTFPCMASYVDCKNIIDTNRNHFKNELQYYSIHICDPIWENRRSTHNNSYLN